VLPRRLVMTLLVPPALLVVGTIGYRFIEGPEWSWLDAAYMAVITLTTVGYQEVHPLSPAGRVFTMAYALGGVFTLFYVAMAMIRFTVSGEFQSILGRRRMERSLAEVRNHFIVCGYGRMGQYVCQQFEDEKLPYVVVDLETNLGAEFPTEFGLFVHGDATSDEALNRAGVTRARGLVTVASSDADNLYITMSARLLNSKLFIVARAEQAAAEEKLRRAGADRVVSPYVLGGSRVAQAALRPNVVDFIDLATRADFADLQIEEIRLEAGSELVGQSLAQRRLHELGLIVAAIRRAKGELLASPSGDTVLEPDSILVVIGSRESLKWLEREASGKK
jgi:voltage-gated potassium channel